MTSLFAKTGTHRQTQLLALILDLSSPISPEWGMDSEFP
jgi:hypothetical protein